MVIVDSLFVEGRYLAIEADCKELCIARTR